MNLRLVSRIIAWLLLVGILVFVISGWGISYTGAIYTATFGLIDRGLANAIHRASHIPVAIIFVAHVLLNIKRVSMRKESRRTWLVNAVLIVIGLLALGVVFYMEFFA